MWNSSISLPDKKTINQDKEGFPEEIYEFTEHIPANFTDVTRNDEALAAQKGYTVDRNIEILECNYSGQSWLVDENTQQIYDIRRTFKKDKSMYIVLSCERRQTDGI